MYFSGLNCSSLGDLGTTPFAFSALFPPITLSCPPFRACPFAHFGRLICALSLLFSIEFIFISPTTLAIAFLDISTILFIDVFHNNVIYPFIDLFDSIVDPCSR